MGGDSYEKKTKKILDLIDYFITHLHECLNFKDYTDSEKRGFQKMIEKTKIKMVKPLYDLRTFKRGFLKLR